MKLTTKLKPMSKENKRILGISLIVSAITMFFTLLISPSKGKKGSRILAVLALLEALAGLCVAIEEPRRLLRRRKERKAVDESELFDEDEAFNAAMAMHDELSSEGEDAPSLCCDVPCDDEATEEDFM